MEAFAFEAVGVVQFGAGQVEQTFFRDENFYAFGGEEEFVWVLVCRKRQVISKAGASAGFDFDADARKRVIFRSLDFPDAVCSSWRYGKHGIKIRYFWQMNGGLAANHREHRGHRVLGQNVTQRSLMRKD